VGTLVLAEIPDTHVAAPVAGDQFALVWMNDNVVDRHTVHVVPLHVSGARIPNLDGPVLRGSHQPLALAVKGDAGDVARVPVEGEDSVRVRGLDIVELDGVVPGGGQVTLVRRNAQAVHLGIWVGNRPGTYPRERFPEAEGPESVTIELKGGPDALVPDGMVVARCDCLLAVCRHKMWGKKRVPVHKMTDILKDARLLLY
jgi:hypothetical protein